ncbi:hypothetical protein P154DRAFT_274754 [Amniculicola lignicola CBS 123094]|uniref:Secreted protein n=1 Tax=Amniculicola lignicola CBS 123094 TaxID=1392246 RepID=A0A6A5WEH3_9PLEO|nr:hypothetical protein P154DRAFT_274754 [Amniculicola lignicola CBS 123094]
MPPLITRLFLTAFPAAYGFSSGWGRIWHHGGERLLLRLCHNEHSMLNIQRLVEHYTGTSISTNSVGMYPPCSSTDFLIYPTHPFSIPRHLFHSPSHPAEETRYNTNQHFQPC